MKKSVIALGLAMFSMTASAEWSFNIRGVAESNPNGYPSIYLQQSGLVEFELGEECNPEVNKKTININLIIEGVAVKMQEYCDPDTKMYTHIPQTKKGNEYIIKQLLAKNSLKVDSIVIPSEGFKEVWEQVKMKKEGGL